jgi:signal transduction histidine kinase/CheY-like chemotaxis protein
MPAFDEPVAVAPLSSGAPGILRRRIRTVALLCAALASAELLFWLGRDAEVTPWWVSIVYPLFFFAATARCLRTAAKLTSEERRSWLCFGLACFSVAVGDVIWAIYDTFLGISPPTPSLVDVAYILVPVFITAGLWYLRVRARTAWFNRVQIGNLGMIFSSLLLAYAFLFYGFMQAAVPTLAAVSAISYGALDLAVALLGFVIVFFHLWSRKRLVIMLILFALVTTVAGDVYYSYSAMNGTYDPSGPLNLVSLLTAALFYWAAFEREALVGGIGIDELTPEAEERAKQWETLLPPLAVAGVLLVAFVFREGLTTSMLPYMAAACVVFVVSLAVRNWWGHQMEAELRLQALAGEAELQAANQELRSEMRARERIERELRQSQKMEALGHLTGGVAHDFNNLLAVILGNLEIAEGHDRLDPSVRERLRDAVDAAGRGAALIQRLLVLSREQALRPESIEVGVLLRDMRSLLERSLGERIRVDLSEDEPLLQCVADRAQLEGAVLNLAVNARDAMPDGGVLSIHVSRVTLDEAHAADHPEAQPGEYIAISTRDTGTGIRSDILDRVFEPFFTTKDVNEGTGLGLSMVYGFAKQSGGYATIDSAVGEGTDVRICLPVAEAPPRALEGEVAIGDYRGRGESVLVVEDDSAVRRLVVALLEELGYRVVSAGDGGEALAALGSMQSIDLLLSDVVLPGGLSGRELAREVGSRRPGVKVLLMSGYTGKLLEREVPLGSADVLLYKPFRRIELARRVRAVLDTRDRSANDR